MCRKLVVTNELNLGNRILGVEALSLPKGEVVEFTHKQLKDIISKGTDEVYGLAINTESGELEMDKDFYVTNMMIKSHINSLVPKIPDDCLANLFYIVIGTHKDKNNLVYDVVSSRYERAVFTEEKVKTLLEMKVISAGATIVGDKVVVAPLEKPKQVETVEKKDEKPVA